MDGESRAIFRSKNYLATDSCRNPEHVRFQRAQDMPGANSNAPGTRPEHHSLWWLLKIEEDND